MDNKLPEDPANNFPPAPVQNQPSVGRLPSPLLVSFILVLILLTALGLYLYQQKISLKPFLLKTPPKIENRQFPLEQTVIGLVLKIEPGSLLVKKNAGEETKVYVSDQIPIRIQKTIPPTKEEKQASGSAKLIGRLMGIEAAALKDIQIGDTVTITTQEKNQQPWAQLIIITRQVKS